jgi:SAM-dependent methyltransferase
MSDTPFPPLDLMDRVGSVRGCDDPEQAYHDLGARGAATIEGALPPDWTWAGKRVLDFGCGAGRTLRHVPDRWAGAEVWGCDIDEESIAWVQANLCPPILGARPNGASPPTSFPEGSFDLIYAVSVFTHISLDWAEWLLEMHRLLADGGLLLATFIGEGAASWIVDEPFDPDTIGMSVSRQGAPWEHGGPMVIHAPWWIEEHWGRLFTIADLRPAGFGAAPGEGHGVVLARREGSACTVEELRAPAPGDDREARWMQHEVGRRVREVGELYGRLAAAATVSPAGPAELVAQRAELDQARAELASARDRVAAIEASTSWRATAPLRALTGALQRKRTSPVRTTDHHDLP